ncbi:MAG TPA: hypothetical protein PLD88_11660 [Candidatus Berkiella sp.]|nr:hypothetical protein [Candidatus Berkiella sp.]
MALSGASLEECSQFEPMILTSQTDKLRCAQLLAALSEAEKTTFIEYLLRKLDQQFQEMMELKLLDA